MNARRILARGIEMMFPERVAQIKAERTAKRTAMQRLLNASRELRLAGRTVERINFCLFPAYAMYKRGDYSGVCELSVNELLGTGR